MAAMDELADAGKIRFIGVSNFSVRELEQAQAGLSRHRIVSNQLRYSLIERTVETGMLDYCKRNQITLLAFSPFGENFSNIKAADSEGVLAMVAAATDRITIRVIGRQDSVQTARPVSVRCETLRQAPASIGRPSNLTPSFADLRHREVSAWVVEGTKTVAVDCVEDAAADGLFAGSIAAAIPS